jgi:hypothetical protein
LTFVLIFSCSKEKSIERKLEGKWLVRKVRIEDGEGFIYDDTIPTGELNFEIQNKMVSGKIKFDYSTITLANFEDSLLLSDFKYRLDVDEVRFYVDPTNLNYNFRILSLTKNDIQIEYYDLQKSQLKRFLFIKKE